MKTLILTTTILIFSLPTLAQADCYDDALDVWIGCHSGHNPQGGWVCDMMARIRLLSCCQTACRVFRNQCGSDIGGAACEHAGINDFVEGICDIRGEALGVLMCANIRRDPTFVEGCVSYCARALDEE